MQFKINKYVSVQLRTYHILEHVVYFISQSYVKVNSRETNPSSISVQTIFKLLYFDEWQPVDFHDYMYLFFQHFTTNFQMFLLVCLKILTISRAFYCSRLFLRHRTSLSNRNYNLMQIFLHKIVTGINFVTRRIVRPSCESKHQSNKVHFK